MDFMANSDAQKRLSNNVPARKKQTAAKSLNNYLNQLGIHFDLNDKEIVEVLELALKERKHDTFVKKLWHILK